MSWGILTSIDLMNCNHDIIINREAITIYIGLLINLIEMKAYGDAQIIHFGTCKEVEGFTMVQLIETSLISGHFVNFTNNAYIDIFSCKEYDSIKAALFTAEFFKAKDLKVSKLERGK